MLQQSGSSPLGVYLKGSALLTGLFKCSNTLRQDLSAWRAGSHPGGPVFVGCPQTVKEIWAETFTLAALSGKKN